MAKLEKIREVVTTSATVAATAERRKNYQRAAIVTKSASSIGSTADRKIRNNC